MQYANDQRLGKKVKVAFERPWTGYWPWDPIWKEGLYAGDGEYGAYVQWPDGSQSVHDWKDVVFL